MIRSQASFRASLPLYVLHTPLWYGARGAGALETTQMQAWLDAIGDRGGGRAFFVGNYRVAGLTVPAGVYLEGESPYSSIITTTSASATVLTMETSSGLRSVKIVSEVARTSGYYVDYGGNDIRVEDCEFDGYYIAIRVGVYNGTIIVKPQIYNNSFRNPVVAAGSGAIRLGYFSNAEVVGNTGTGPALPATQPDFGLSIHRGDTAFIAFNNFTIHGKALLVDTPAGVAAVAVKMLGNVWDSAGTITGGATVSSAEIIPAGETHDWESIGNWYGLSQSKSGCYMAPPVGGLIDGWTSVGDRFSYNGDCGLLFVSPRVKNLTVTAYQACANTSGGWRAAGAPTGFSITNGRSGPISGAAGNGYGFIIDNGTAADDYINSGNDYRGNVTAAGFNGGTGTNKREIGNLGYVAENKNSASGTTDGSGDLTITHGLAATPAQVTVTTTGTTFAVPQVHTKGASTFKIRFYDAGGAAITATALTADWVAEI